MTLWYFNDVSISNAFYWLNDFIGSGTQMNIRLWLMRYYFQTSRLKSSNKKSYIRTSVLEGFKPRCTYDITAFLFSIFFLLKNEPVHTTRHTGVSYSCPHVWRIYFLWRRDYFLWPPMRRFASPTDWLMYHSACAVPRAADQSVVWVMWRTCCDVINVAEANISMRMCRI